MELLVRELGQCESWAQGCEVRLCGFRRRQGRGSCLSQGQVKFEGGLAPFQGEPAAPVTSVVLSSGRGQKPTRQPNFCRDCGEGVVLGIRPTAQGCWTSAYHRALMHSDIVWVNSHFPSCRLEEQAGCGSSKSKAGCGLSHVPSCPVEAPGRTVLC